MIYISSDHCGFNLKEKIKIFLKRKKYEFEDLGPSKLKKDDDYPDYAIKVARKVSKSKNSLGIVICCSGHGMNITTNKIKGIRASICWNVKSAEYAKKHTRINVLCLPSKFLTEENSRRIIEKWIKTKESYAKRHLRRLNKIKKIEK
jgi:ribose 5-phosphate isomerase B